jgi:signal transduction histidine kinase
MMSIDPASIHGQRYLRIGDIIYQDTERIIERWQKRCAELRPDAAGGEQTLAMEQIREFLQALAEQLVSTRRQALEPQQLAADLGALRWTLGWDLREVVREYKLLRLILLDHLDSQCDTPLERDELLAVSLNFDEAITAAVARYVEHEERVRDDYEDELERSNRELKRFAHVVAHELKSPLNAQLLGLQLIEFSLGEAANQGELRDVLKTTKTCVQQMAGLINELLQYAEVGSDESAQQSISCREVLDAALANLQAQIAASDARVEYGDLPTVSANPSTLTLVFQNLISNAIYYRRDVAPEIRIDACPQQGEWQFTVTDNGAGIPAEDVSRIFEMFARAHADLRPQGTGIGLAMCRRIVEEHGGRIWVESEPGVGSRFCFTIPADIQSSPVEQRQHEQVSVS